MNVCTGDALFQVRPVAFHAAHINISPRILASTMIYCLVVIEALEFSKEKTAKMLY